MDAERNITVTIIGRSIISCTSSYVGIISVEYPPKTQPNQSLPSLLHRETISLFPLVEMVVLLINLALDLALLERQREGRGGNTPTNDYDISLG